MIVFNLECAVCSVRFEGWFDSSKEFETQKKRNLINCPSCNSISVKKTLTAPNVSKKSNGKDKKIKKSIATNLSKYKKSFTFIKMKDNKLFNNLFVHYEPRLKHLKRLKGC